MEDKIKNLTDKIYNEGVVKARDEAEKIMHEARHKADGLLADAQKQAEMIISKATSDAEEVSSNIREEIRHASNQAINIIKQKVGELITLSITDRPLKELVNDQQFILDTVKLMMDQWGHRVIEKVSHWSYPNLWTRMPQMSSPIKFTNNLEIKSI